jgi:hypothetical protein
MVELAMVRAHMTPTTFTYLIVVIVYVANAVVATNFTVSFVAFIEYALVALAIIF